MNVDSPRPTVPYCLACVGCAIWGRSNLASSGLTSLETARHVWQARFDRRRRPLDWPLLPWYGRS